MSYTMLGSRVAAVRDRIAAACGRVGRSPSEVTLVAVTKTHPVQAVEAVLRAGLTEVGENRVQELEEKVAVVGREGVRWHLIGRLQRNKAKRAIRLFDLLHSLDSIRLAEKLGDEAAAADLTVDALIQINAGAEETKAGFDPEEAVDAIGRICEIPHLRIRGLMTMAPFTDDERILRTAFAATRETFEEARRQLPTFTGEQLSMGMSNDFEIAVEEGSTLVRLGTVLLGERST